MSPARADLRGAERGRPAARGACPERGCVWRLARSRAARARGGAA